MKKHVQCGPLSKGTHECWTCAKVSVWQMYSYSWALQQMTDVVGAGTFLHTCAVYWCSISRHLQLQCQLSESHTVVCPFGSGLHCTPSVHHSCDIFVMPSSSHSLRVLARHRHTFHSKLLQEIWWKYTGGWRWRDSTVFKHRISL